MADAPRVGVMIAGFSEQVETTELGQLLFGGRLSDQTFKLLKH